MSGIFAQQTDTSHDNRTFHIHPPLLAAALLIIGLLLHLAARHEAARFPFTELFGLLLVALGSGLCCYAAALFTAANTTRNPYGGAAALVIAPPYTFTRNPMYVGLATILFGFAVFFASPTMLLAPIVCAVVIDRMVIPHEERTMQRLYGEQYLKYKDRVPRWLPLPSFLHALTF
jgi:protein-S-isoprenylcysteine O-methyltransferase Ste14